MNKAAGFFVLAISAGLLATGCLNQSDEPDRTAGAPQEKNTAAAAVIPPAENRLVSYTNEREPCADYNESRKPLFGDLHVHTAMSFDAVAGRINTMPEDAYDYARGKSIPFFPQDEDGNPTGTLKIDRPLDFLAVTDHAEFLGERALCTDASYASYNGEFCQKYREIEFRGTLMLATVISMKDPKRIEMLCGADNRLCLEAAKGPWARTIAAAQAANDRSDACTFTSLVGYEYTGTPDDSNYHRNVIFRNANVPALPVSYIEAPLDYMLWAQLDEKCGENDNCDYLTIPHNSNMSNGKLLTPYADLAPTIENKTQYAKSRLNREPLMEIFQHKGASECVNGLSSVLGAVDELCDIEQVRIFGQVSQAKGFHLEGTKLVFHPPEDAIAQDCDGEAGSLGMFAGGCISQNDFLRTALLTGLKEERVTGFNPLKLGVIASTDGHTGTPGNVVESEWRGSVSGEMSVKSRLEPGTLPSGIKGNPGGLAGVWAMENSRDAIFEALERRETFGTSGPRIVPRFFAGWDFEKSSCNNSDMVAQGYSRGVPMGGDLSAPDNDSQRPTFIVGANRDPVESSTPLQKLQVIKGWIDSKDLQHTKVFTVAGEEDNDAGVDLETGERFGPGHNSLCAVFVDAEFDPSQSSYYYLRAVENPSPRWSLLDCLSLPESERPEVCSNTKKHIIQEMAWSSPIWYNPKTAN
jgi:hypothetical protein